MQIVSKIETKVGIKNLNSIIDVSDYIMIARGTLGTPFLAEQIASFLETGAYRKEISKVMNAIIGQESATKNDKTTLQNIFLYNICKVYKQILNDL